MKGRVQGDRGVMGRNIRQGCSGPRGEGKRHKRTETLCTYTVCVITLDIHVKDKDMSDMGMKSRDSRARGHKG